MTRTELFQLVTVSMFHNLPIELTDYGRNVHTGVVNSIGREDGGGYRFIVRFSDGSQVYMQCKS